MSMNHLSRQMINEPMTPDKWPQMMKWMAENGYRVLFWSSIDFPSIVPNYYVGVQDGKGFQQMTRMQDIRAWMPGGVMTMYAEVLKFERQKQMEEEAAQKEKEVIENANTPQPGELPKPPESVVDGGGVPG